MIWLRLIVLNMTLIYIFIKIMNTIFLDPFKLCFLSYLGHEKKACFRKIPLAGDWTTESFVFLSPPSSTPAICMLSSSLPPAGQPSLRLTVSHSHAPAPLDAVPFWLETPAAGEVVASMPVAEGMADLELTLCHLQCAKKAKEKAVTWTQRIMDLFLVL